MNGVQRAKTYCKAVLSSKSIAPQTIKLACQRFLDDQARKDIYLDVDAANNAVSIVEMMPITKGKGQGMAVKMQPWQCFLIVNLMGWKKEATGHRRYRYCYLQVPRKNGKSALMVYMGLLFFGADNELGAEVYFGASGKEQAKNLLYRPAKYVVDHFPEYREQFSMEAGAGTITRVDNDSLLTTVIRKPSDGTSPHFAGLDEYHEHVDNSQYETFDTGMGSREQPLLFMATTAGYLQSGVCKAERDDCIKLLNGTIENDSKFALIYEPDEDDDWQDLETTIKVNPNIDVTVNRSYLESQLHQAKQSATSQNSFRTKHLNEWVGSRAAWMDIVAWNRQMSDRPITDFIGQDCYLTCDLASKLDIAALVLTFRQADKYYTYPFFYIPEIRRNEYEHYRAMCESGDLIATPGNMTDYAFIEAEILDIVSKYNVKAIGIDPYNANYLITRLQKNLAIAERVLEYTHTVRNMSEPMKELEALIIDGRYYHDGNTCQTWMMGNVVASYDAKDNIYPRKESDNDPLCKIDGVICSIMGVGMYSNESEPEPNPYEDRGFRTL